MKFTGNLWFNVFEGDENKAKMTRAIAKVGGVEYAFYMNELEGGVVIAAYLVTGRNGNSPIVEKNPVAQTVATEVVMPGQKDEPEAEEREYIFDMQLDDTTFISEFIIGAQKDNRNGNPVRLAQPKEIAALRRNVVEKTEKDQGTGTNGRAL